MAEEEEGKNEETISSTEEKVFQPSKIKIIRIEDMEKREED